MPERKIVLVKSVEEQPEDVKAIETDAKIVDQIFPLIVWSMKMLGLWPANRIPLRRRIFVFLNIFYVHGPIMIYVFKNRNNFLEASYAICEMGAGLIYYWRLLWCGFFSDIYLEVIDDLVKVWRKANNFDIPEWNINRKKIVTNTYRFSSFLIIYFLLAGLKYSVVTIGLQLFRVYVLEKDERIDFGYHIDYIVNVLDPFDPIGYSVLVIPMLIIFMTFIYALSLTGVFYALIIYYTGILFRMVCIKINELDRKLSDMNPDQVLKELKAITIAHQEAIRVARKLDIAMRYSMLFQVLINSFFICMIGFDIFAIKSDFTTITNLAGYGTAILSELFLDSYVCDFLTREAAKVPAVVWNTKWYAQTPKVRRHFLLIMAYGQTTIGVSAGKFHLISLNSFLQVVRAGISYFTLMRQIYAK